MSRMRVVAVLGIVSAVWVGAVVHAAQVQPASSTWDGVYTDAQAKLGQDAYTKACAECHGQDLAGDGFAPGLKGPDFLTNWNGLSVGDLFDRIRVSMPPDNPSSVGSKEKIEIVAYILKEGGFPAGQAELPTALDGLKTIKIDANKPGQ